MDCKIDKDLMYSKYVFTQPLHHGQDVTQGQFFSGILLIWISFSFKTSCHAKTKELSLPYYLPIAERERENMS